ncbi:uncharacterized protein DSM5745_00997 [Aspergillus mulundensis]|uniref:Uncharacterized protein n=1 Tax=Aspergillus mulundensis TaxID=1810919 RepID=A0A3D8T542_9EURO|nr:hypothetical protein DSM5745_00997 [Aspergillus mulundensis]RDW93675.1 hypothetical protein DSM5745_00997 [Aspergillus mulundensis]
MYRPDFTPRTPQNSISEDHRSIIDQLATLQHGGSSRQGTRQDSEGGSITVDRPLFTMTGEARQTAPRQTSEGGHASRSSVDSDASASAKSDGNAGAGSDGNAPAFANRLSNVFRKGSADIREWKED